MFGEFSPSGKLPVSFERRFEDNAVYKSYYADPPESKKVKYTEGVFVGYRYFDKSGTKPLFPFGYGLSYTSFKYDHLAISPQSGNLNTPISVIFDVTNTGPREGAEVAEIYVGDSHASVPRPVKELRGFARINLKPGQTQRVMLILDRRAFCYYDVQGKNWRADPGEFNILVGGSSDNTPLKGTFTLAQ